MATEPTSPPSGTSPPTAPSIGDSPSTFQTQADAFVAWMVGFFSYLGSLASWISTTATQVYNNAVEAAASATSASAASNAAEWVSAASYAEGDLVWSSTDHLTYRAKTTHSGVATDPSSDSTNWTLAVGAGAAPLFSPLFTGTPAAPTVAAGDTSTKIATTAFVDQAIKDHPPLSKSVVASPVSSIILSLSGHKAFRVVMRGVQASATTTLRVQFGDSSSTFHTGVSDYGWNYKLNASAPTSDGTDSSMALFPLETSVLWDASAVFDIYPSADGSRASAIRGQGVRADDILDCAGWLQLASHPATHLKIFPLTGTITAGEFFLYPLTEVT